MKVFYTDERGQKVLLGESKDIQEVAMLLQIDARKKFISLNLQPILNKADKRIDFTREDGSPTGYSVEI